MTFLSYRSRSGRALSSAACRIAQPQPPAVLVVNADSDLTRGTVERLAASGLRIALGFRDKGDKLDALIEQVWDAGGTIVAFEVADSLDGNLRTVRTQAEALIGRIDFVLDRADDQSGDAGSSATKASAKRTARCGLPDTTDTSSDWYGAVAD